MLNIGISILILTGTFACHVRTFTIAHNYIRFGSHLHGLPLSSSHHQHVVMACQNKQPSVDLNQQLDYNHANTRFQPYRLRLFRKPSFSVEYWSGTATTLHVPSILGPVVCQRTDQCGFPSRFNGNRWLSFFSNTNVSAAILRAAIRFFSSDIFSPYVSCHNILYGFWNNPNLYFASSTRRQAVSISAIDTLPDFTDPSRVFRKPSEHISISVPAFNAWAEEEAMSPTPCTTISPYRTIIRYDKSIRFPFDDRHMVSNHLLAVAGTPSTILKDDMKLPAPASAAAL